MEIEFLHNCGADDIKAQLQSAVNDGWDIHTVIPTHSGMYSVVLTRELAGSG